MGRFGSQRVLEQDKVLLHRLRNALALLTNFQNFRDCTCTALSCRRSYLSRPLTRPEENRQCPSDS